MAIFIDLLAFVTSYLFFSIVVIDPRAEATVYVGNPIYGIRYSRNGRDPLFTLWGRGVLLWTALLFALLKFNKVGNCSMTPQSFISLQTLQAFLTITVVSKILVGPILKVRKSVKLIGESKVVQPWIFKAYDAIILWPTNIFVKFSWKISMIPLMMLIVWILHFLGLLRKQFMIPDPVIFAWVIACFGKVATMILYSKPPYLVQILIYLTTLICVTIVWNLTESTLKGCGMEPGELPSLGVLAGGRIGLPITEFIVTCIASIF